MGPNETADIRRSLDRLQQSFEILNDRYRELRRERKQLRERIDELHRERALADTAVAVQLEMAQQDRQRAAELEVRAQEAERRNEEVGIRIADLERSLAERDALIADHQEMLVRLREQLEADRQKDEANWMQSEGRREELEELRRQLATVHAESEAYRAQLDRLSVVNDGEIVVPASTIEELRSEATSLRQLVAQLQQDRIDLEGKYLQTIGKLDAATLAEAMARTDVASLIQEKDVLDSSLAELRQAHAQIQQQLAENMREDTSAEDAERELARERELQELHAAIQRGEDLHAAERATLRDGLAAAAMEQERLERQADELRQQRDAARAAAETLKEELSKLNTGDDERLKAQRVRIEGLNEELEYALDMAARKELEAGTNAQALEEAQAQIARLNKELEMLRANVEQENGLKADLALLGGEDRRHITSQIDTAIRLIDQHLQDE